MEIITTLCNQWIEQYKALAKSRDAITESMKDLKHLIEKNGGTISETVPETAPVVIAPIVADVAPIITTQVDLNAIQIPLDAVYNKKWTWAYKIVFILMQNGGYLDVLKIADSIKTEEPEREFKDLVKAITMAASKMGVEEKIEVKKTRNKNFYKYKNLSIIQPLHKAAIGAVIEQKEKDTSMLFSQ